MHEVLLVIDAQRALLDELTPERRAELVGTLATLLGRARAERVPVVYVRHDGSPSELVPATPGWEIASEIAPCDDEPIVEKRFGDAFEETELAHVLAAMSGERLTVAGLQTDFCVRATIGGAIERVTA